MGSNPFPCTFFIIFQYHLDCIQSRAYCFQGVAMDEYKSCVGKHLFDVEEIREIIGVFEKDWFVVSCNELDLFTHLCKERNVFSGNEHLNGFFVEKKPIFLCPEGLFL